MAKPDITQSELRRMFRYDPDTGDFIRLEICKWQSRRIGTVAGTTDWRGRRYLHINHRVYLAHRLIWLYVYGRFPTFEIDHIDRNPSNNRLNNLREATRRQNQINRIPPKGKSGFTGVHRRADDKAWVAVAQNGEGKNVYLGSFKKIEEASSAYKRFRVAVSGEFAPIEYAHSVHLVPE